MDYVELHLHDHYSVLDGLNTPKEYMERAKELGMTHLAQSNHGTLTGHREFQRAADEAGIIPILGVEAYISSTDRFDRRAVSKRDDGTQVFNHIGLLAMNKNGLHNLNLMMSEAWNSGYYYKPRIDMHLLEEYNQDIIVLSGCMGGLISKSLEAGDTDRAYKTAKHLQSIFGERFAIEIQGHNPPELNAGLLGIAERFDIMPVVTSDCHYARKEDLWVEEAMLILASGPKVNRDFDLPKSQKMDMLERFNYLYPDRKMTFEKIEIYLRSAAEQQALLETQGIGTQPILNTMTLANMIGDYPYWQGLDLLPTPDDTIEDLDAELRRQAFDGLARRGFADNEEYVERLEHELDVIKQMGFAVYFLILSDVIAYAHEQKIFVGPGRGSGISSLVNYSLFITNIDPIPYKLLFFRFLDPDRPDWPDIDVDFEKNRRWEIKEYVKRKYGNVANIMTFTLYRDKSAIKAAARVFKIPVGVVNKAMAGIKDMEGYETAESTKAFRTKYPEVAKLAKRLEGRIASTGIHAGGTVLSKQPIEDYVPMQTALDPQDDSKDRVAVAAADMGNLADIGMIKYDFLGLTNLTVILDTIAAIKERHGIEIDPYEISLDDAQVYKELSAGHTKGVFQCEGGPYTNLLIDTPGGINNFEDLVSSNALVRPGADKSSIGKAYRVGKETGSFEYIHASTKYFTSETFGQILFQEQQMLLCIEVAGMSMREANQVRQAIGKKKADKLAIWEPAFIEGATKTIGERKAKAVWKDLEKSAEYAFNRAHSVGYSLISYWTAWFKTHYPVEYMTNLIKNVDGTDSARKTMEYLMEAKRIGVKVLLPNINQSGIENTIEGEGMRLGLSSIKGIARKSAGKIIEHRPYASWEDFTTKAQEKGSGINATAVANINKVGAGTFSDNPKRGDEREYFYELLSIPAFDHGDIDPKIKAQFSPFNQFAEDETFVCAGMVIGVRVGQGWSLIDLADETGTISVFARQDTPMEKGKMYIALISNNSIARYITPDDFNEGEGGVFAQYLKKDKLELAEDEVVCISFNTRRTKGGFVIGEAVLADAEKNLLGVTMLGEQTVESVKMTCITASKFKPKLGEGRDGGITLRGIA